MADLDFIYDNYDPDNMDSEARVMIQESLIHGREDEPCKKCNTKIACVFTGCDERFNWWEKAIQEEMDKWRKAYKERHEV